MKGLYVPMAHLGQRGDIQKLVVLDMGLFDRHTRGCIDIRVVGKLQQEGYQMEEVKRARTKVSSRGR